MEATIVVREIQPSDEPFIYSTWCNGMYYGACEPVEITRKQFFKNGSAYIKEILPHIKAAIACLSDDPDTIAGYSIVDGEHLEFIYVKEKLRRQGIARLLSNINPFLTVSRFTHLGKLISDKLNLKEEIHGSQEEIRRTKKSSAYSKANR